MDSKLPVFVTTARDRLVAAYKSPAGRRRFDRILDYEADRDHKVAWTIFAAAVCPKLPHNFVLDAVDLARTALIAEKYQARARERIAARVGA